MKILDPYKKQEYTITKGDESFTIYFKLIPYSLHVELKNIASRFIYDNEMSMQVLEMKSGKQEELILKECIEGWKDVCDESGKEIKFNKETFLDYIKPFATEINNYIVSVSELKPIDKKK